MIHPTPEMLVGREARCACRKTVPSASACRAFFHYRGPGSGVCGLCGYYDVAHDDQYETNPGTGRPNPKRCAGFIDGMAFDSYYCGCRGWD